MLSNIVDDISVALLQDTTDILLDEKLIHDDLLPSRDIVKRLGEDELWSTYHNGEPITVPELHRKLDAIGIASELVPCEDKSREGYSLTKLSKALKEGEDRGVDFKGAGNRVRGRATENFKKNYQSPTEKKPVAIDSTPQMTRTSQLRTWCKNRRPGQHLPEGAREIVARLLKSGEYPTRQSITNEFGISLPTMTRWFGRLWSTKKYSSKTKRTALQRAHSGENVAQVAKDMDICLKTLKYWIAVSPQLGNSQPAESPPSAQSQSVLSAEMDQLAKQASKRSLKTDPLKTAVRQLASKGAGIREISRNTGIPHSTVSRWANEELQPTPQPEAAAEGINFKVKGITISCSPEEAARFFSQYEEK